ncbi:MAG TPA: hypothetical protein VGK24_18245 [Candidatus Angelobacter sp.]|jgi:hypothetical protein
MWLSILLLLVAFLPSNIDSGKTQARVLKAGHTRLLDIPQFGFYGTPQSDEDGDMFFHANTGSFSAAVVLKLSHSSYAPTVYVADEISQTHLMFLGFSVTPEGIVSILAQGLDKKIYSIKFSSAGAVIQRTILYIPEKFAVNDFAVFESGTIIVSGFYLPEAAPELRGKSLITFFDESGTIKKQLKDDISAIDVAKAIKKISEGGSTIGKDGCLYILQGNEILVMGQEGDIVRRIKYEKPEEYSATKIAISRGLISVWLAKNEGDYGIVPEYIILNQSSGEMMAEYVPETELGNNAISFSAADGFTFFKIESGKVKLTTAALR